MEHELRQNLLDLASALASIDGKTFPTIGKLALNDNTFFQRIERGDGFNVKTYDRLLQWFSDNWPEGGELDWPSALPRPSPSPRTEAA